MKATYDFSKAMKDKLYRPKRSLQIPVYLDADVQERLRKIPRGRRSKVVNELLRSQFNVMEMIR
jgi:hypothetical protein